MLSSSTSLPSCVIIKTLKAMNFLLRMALATYGKFRYTLPLLSFIWNNFLSLIYNFWAPHQKRFLFVFNTQVLWWSLLVLMILLYFHFIHLWSENINTFLWKLINTFCMALDMNKCLCINKHCRGIWKDYVLSIYILQSGQYVSTASISLLYNSGPPRMLGSFRLVTIQSHLGSEVFIFTPQFHHKSLVRFSTRLPTFF